MLLGYNIVLLSRLYFLRRDKDKARERAKLLRLVGRSEGHLHSTPTFHGGLLVLMLVV